MLAHIGLLKACTSYDIIGNTFCLRSEGWHASRLASDSEVVINDCRKAGDSPLDQPGWGTQWATAPWGAGPSSQ